MRRQIFGLTFAALPLAVALSAEADLLVRTTSDGVRTPSDVAPAPRSAGVEVDVLDRKMDPCTDFYQFACGGWIAQNPVPPDRQSFSRVSQLQEHNLTILRGILEASAADGDRRKAADYYAACMDDAGIEAHGLTPIGPDLATIDEILNPDDLPVLVAHLHAYGVPALFRFGAQTDLTDAANAIANVDQAGLGLPDREYYLKTDDRTAGLRAKYVALIQTMFGLAGEPADQAAADAKAVLALETTMATAMLDRVKRRDPASTQHRMTINELQALSPNFNWRKYAAAAEAPPLPTINVAVPAYLRALDTLVTLNSMNDLKAYMRWHVLHASADLLPKAFADAHFDFFNRTLTGQQAEPPRWRRCVADTDAQLGEAVGKAFVEQTFSPQAKADTLQMVHDIEQAMRQDVGAAPWMSDDTKKAAIAKLEAVVDRIGYPDEWRDYSSVRVTRDDALGNRQRSLLFNRKRTLAKIGQPVDRSEWSMTPATVNAYYSPDRNTINFPAGILQPPFYRAGRDAAVNYGAAGAIIGHELTHGFDDQGRKFDGQGKLRDWWAPADGKAYDERASCIADQYSAYTVAGDIKIDGRLTLGENTADNGGARLAVMAYLAGPGAKAKDKVDGFTPEQRFFIGFAQKNCGSSRPEAERLQAQTDPHSATRYRVNGPVSNMPEFQKAFSCKANAPMVRASACRVW